MTTTQFAEFCEQTRVGDSFTLRNGDRRMVIHDMNTYACIDPDTGQVTTDWYESKAALLEKFEGKVC